MASSTFSGPIRVGKNTGVPGNTVLGTLIATQLVSLASNTSGASTIVLPQNAQITDMVVIVQTSASANTQGMLIRVGTTSDATYFANIKCSAPGLYSPFSAPNLTAASAAAWKNVNSSNAQQLYIDVTAATSAAGQTDNFEGILLVSYFQRP